MTRPRPRLGSELLPVCLILGCLAGAWWLVTAMHQRASVERKKVAAARPPAVVPTPAPPAPPPVVPPAPPPEPPPLPPEDPTRTIVARLGAEEAEQRLEAQAADRRAEALERARQAALADAERWKRREQIVRDQAEALDRRAETLEKEVGALARERDVLARERDATKAALVKASRRSSFAVLPHRGPNGTWRRPIMIECRNGTATLQPHGPTFSLLDMSGLLGARSSPIVLAVVRELMRIQGTSAPDGTPATPYIFFVVRPDGIRPYYEARARLESLGIAFGYELVDPDMEIDYPDLDHPDEWDGSAPLSTFPVVALADGTPGGGGSRGGPSEDEFRWPASRGGPPEGAGPLSGTTAGDLRRRGSGAGSSDGGPGRELLRPSGGDRSGPGTASGRPSPSGGTPGMLPLSGGSTRTPGMLPPSAGPPGSSGLAAANPAAGLPSRDDAGRGFPALAHPDDLSDLERLTRPGPGGAVPASRPGGLEPGEPGAPPEEGSVPAASGRRPFGRGDAPLGGGHSPEGGSLGEGGGGFSSGGGGSEGTPGSPHGGGGGLVSPERGPARIEVPLEIVVACGPSGVTIHPGGYQFTSKALKGKDEVLARSLKTILRHRQQVDPLIRPRPSIRFLVEPGGGETYRDARRQTFLSGIDWPTVLQVSDTRVLDLWSRERF